MIARREFTQEGGSDLEALRVAAREGRSLWEHMSSSERSLTRHTVVALLASLVVVAIVDSAALPLILFGGGVLFAALCHAYRINVVAPGRKERRISAAALGTGRSLAFFACCGLVVAVINVFFPVKRYGDELQTILHLLTTLTATGTIANHWRQRRR